MSSIWEQLGIEPTTDQRKIKKAYADQVKNCHQEDEPERWQQLHASYEAAIRYAKGAVREQEAPTERRMPKQQEVPTERRMPEQQEPPVRMTSYREETAQKDEAEQQGVLYQKLFEDLDEQYQETGMWQKQKPVLERKMQELASLERKRQADGVGAFFRDYQVSQLYLNMEFWRFFLLFLQKNKFDKSVYLSIWQEVGIIRESIRMQAPPELLKLTEQIQRYCCEKEKRRKKRTAAAVWFVAAALVVTSMILLRVGINMVKERATGPVQDYFASYLNSKYGTDLYQGSQFEYEEITVTVQTPGIYEQVNAGYFITTKDESAFRGYILIFHDLDSEKEERICFDNVQLSEIERALAAEFCGMTGLDDSRAFLGQSTDTYELDCLQSKDVVYHAKFDGKIQAFLTEEAKARTKVFGQYIDGSSEEQIEMINGAVFFYYPDGEVKSLRDRLELKRDMAEEGWEEQLGNLEENGKVQVFAIGLPEEYYRLLFEGKDEDAEQQVADHLRGYRRYYDLDFPINPFFATEGYWKPEYPAAQETSLDVQGLWYQTREAEEIAEGVYAIRKTNSTAADGVGMPVEASAEIDKSGRKITFIAAGDDLSFYVFILDREQLNIGTVYDIVKKNGNAFDHSSYERIEMNVSSDTIYDSGDLLVIEPFYDLSEDGQLVFEWKE